VGWTRVWRCNPAPVPVLAGHWDASPFPQGTPTLYGNSGRWLSLASLPCRKPPPSLASWVPRRRSRETAFTPGIRRDVAYTVCQSQPSRYLALESTKTPTGPQDPVPRPSGPRNLAGILHCTQYRFQVGEILGDFVNPMIPILRGPGCSNAKANPEEPRSARQQPVQGVGETELGSKRAVSGVAVLRLVSFASARICSKGRDTGSMERREQSFFPAIFTALSVFARESGSPRAALVSHHSSSTPLELNDAVEPWELLVWMRRMIPVTGR